MGAKQLTNLEKTAILLLGFGEEVAGEILRHMTEVEVKKLASTMNRLGRIDQALIDEVMNEFHALLQSETTLMRGGKDFTASVLEKAFGHEGSKNYIKYALAGSASIEAVHLIDGKILAQIIRSEHPQTIATILAYTPPKKAGEAIKNLPQAIQNEVMTRIAKLEPIDPVLIDELDSYLREEVEKLGSWGRNKKGGKEFLAKMLSSMDRNSEKSLTNFMEEKDPVLADDIRQLMFTFDDLTKLTGPGIQELLKEINNRDLLIALKKCSETVLQFFLSNMSQRAQQILLDDLDALPSLKVSEVESKQNQIVQTARRLADEGRIQIQTDQDKYV